MTVTTQPTPEQCGAWAKHAVIIARDLDGPGYDLDSLVAAVDHELRELVAAGGSVLVSYPEFLRNLAVMAAELVKGDR